MEITEVVVLVILFCIGAILGSFACCQAWRLRLKELGKKSPGKWSVCLSCGKRLKSTENIPIFSWLLQKGKCKHCGAKIGKAELFAEVSLGAAFVALGVFFYPELITALSLRDVWYLPMLILIMVLLTFSLTIMWILLIYDAKWQKLPTKLLTFLNICAILYTILRFVGIFLSAVSTKTFPSDLWGPLLSTIGGAAILGGTYFMLSFFSKEKLVGSGDWLVALPISLFLGNWWLCLVALFLSNFLGSLYGIYQKARYHKHQIPFGPFLIIAFVATFVAQPWLLSLIATL